MIIKYFHIYKWKHLLKNGIPKLNTQGIFRNLKFAKTWTFLMSICLFKVNIRNTKAKCKTCSKLRIKTPERHQWHCSGVFTLFGKKNFAKIRTYLSGSRYSQFQRTRLNCCLGNNSFTRVVKIWKLLQNVSVGAVRECF